MFLNAKKGDPIIGQVSQGTIIGVPFKGPKGGLYAAVDWGGRINPKVNLRGPVWASLQARQEEERGIIRQPIELKTQASILPHVEKGKYNLTFTCMSQEELRELHRCLYGGDFPSDMTERLQEKLVEALSVRGLRGLVPAL